MKIKIEKNITMPDRGLKARRLRDAVAAMKVGDSFEVSNRDYYTLNIIITKLNRMEGDVPFFTTRKMDSKTKRCWRVR